MSHFLSRLITRWTGLDAWPLFHHAVLRDADAGDEPSEPDNHRLSNQD